MQDNLFHDDRVFDRLVDGELSAAERHALLVSLDDRPDGWRRCALVFLEAQCWTENLGEFVREPQAAKIIAVDADKNAAPARTPLMRRSTRHRVAWLAMAAGLLVAFTLGLMLRDGQLPIANQPAGDPNAQIANVMPGPPSPDAERDEEALTFWVRDQSGRARPVHVPLVDAGTLDRQLGLQFQTGVPAQVRSELQDRGFDVQSKRRYAPLWLENGHPMIVPVEDTKIVPVNQKVY